MEEESKRKHSDPNVQVRIDESGRQYVDLEHLLSKPCVRKTLEDLQSRFPGNAAEPKVPAACRGGCPLDIGPILTIIDGYWFLTRNKFTRYGVVRQSGYHLFLNSAFTPATIVCKWM